MNLNSDHSSVVLLTLNVYSPTRPQHPTILNFTTGRCKLHDLVNQEIKLNIRLKSTDDIDQAVNC